MPAFAWLLPLSLLVADGGVSVPRPSLLAPVIGGRPEAPVQEYRLRPAREGGGYEYEDARFLARVSRDGRVAFEDHGMSKGWRWVPFMPEAHPPGTKTLEGSVRELLGGRRARPAAPPPAPALPAPTETAKAPPTELERKSRIIVIPAVMNDRFDLTDAYMRMMGQDPYRYEKAKFLAATFETRLALAVRAEAVDMRAALPELPRRLAALWADRSQPPVARRRLICGLYQELRKDPRASAGPRAVLDFVRTTLPRGSAAGYSEAELAACNQGQPAAAHFAPYESSEDAKPVTAP